MTREDRPAGARDRPVVVLEPGDSLDKALRTFRSLVARSGLVAELRRLSQLRGRNLPETILADRLAVHRPVLSLSASAVGMAQSHAGMG